MKQYILKTHVIISRKIERINEKTTRRRFCCLQQQENERRLVILGELEENTFLNCYKHLKQLSLPYARI